MKRKFKVVKANKITFSELPGSVQKSLNEIKVTKIIDFINKGKFGYTIYVAFLSLDKEDLGKLVRSSDFKSIGVVVKNGEPHLVMYFKF